VHCLAVCPTTFWPICSFASFPIYRESSCGYRFKTPALFERVCYWMIRSPLLSSAYVSEDVSVFPLLPAVADPLVCPWLLVCVECFENPSCFDCDPFRRFRFRSLGRCTMASSVEENSNVPQERFTELSRTLCRCLLCFCFESRCAYCFGFDLEAHFSSPSSSSSSRWLCVSRTASFCPHGFTLSSARLPCQSSTSS
jgi:hypothetical protein